MNGSRLAFAAICAAVLLAASRPGLAHKPITSPFTFDEDVRPILQEHCVSCHVNGGVTPMALMTYADTVPWAESIRVELVAGHMPPWGIEGGGSHFSNTKPLTARELNVVLTWAAGGTPRGTAAPLPTPEVSTRTWPLGEPDLKLQPTREYVMAADVQDHVEEFTIETGITETRWLRAVDVLPGDPTIVRSAAVALAIDKGATPVREVPLALWVPGDTPVATVEGTGFALPAGARLTLRVRYKKTWQRERDVIRDRSSVGLYFTSGMATPIQAATLSAMDSVPNVPDQVAGVARSLPETRTVPETLRLVDTWPWQSWDRLPSNADAIAFSRTLGADVRAYAVYTEPDLHEVTITVLAVTPAGARETLIAFRPQAGWTRRYWFREPKWLGRGGRIEIHAARDPAELLPPGAMHRDPVDLEKLRITLDVVRAN